MARVSVVPDLIDALVTQSRPALGDLYDDDDPRTVTVYDGIGNSEEPGAYLMVGVDDPDDGTLPRAADAQQSWAHANGRARDEEGDVSLAAMAWSGGGSDDAQQLVRDQVYAIAGVLADLCRGVNPSLGVDGVLWTSFGTSLTLTQDITDDGAVIALLLFKIHFKARI